MNFLCESYEIPIQNLSPHKNKNLTRRRLFHANRMRNSHGRMNILYGALDSVNIYSDCVWHLFVARPFHITRPLPNDRAVLILPFRHYSCNAHLQYDRSTWHTSEPSLVSPFIIRDVCCYLHGLL